MHCFNCGRELRDDSKFCSYCGVRLDEKPIEDAASANQETADGGQGSQVFFVVSRVVIFVAAVLALMAVMSFIRS